MTVVSVPHVVVVALYVLAALLPIAGFGRLLTRVQRGLNEARRRVNERGHSAMLIGEFDDAHADIREPFLRERVDLTWDIVFVGSGLIAGAAASIWSLFL